MTYTPTIYDWRLNVAPVNQTFRAAGESYAGGVTLGGTIIEAPEPGGRAELFMEFAPFATPAANRDASWTISRCTSGNLMRVALWDSVQLVPSTDLLGDVNGLLWANNLPWSAGQYWRYDPRAPITAAAAKGATTFTVDMSAYGEVLGIGHVIGVSEGYDVSHAVMDISYAGATIATVTVSPPLRRAVTASSEIKFRPSMIVQCKNAREIASQFVSGRHMTLAPAHFVEAIL